MGSGGRQLPDQDHTAQSAAASLRCCLGTEGRCFPKGSLAALASGTRSAELSASASLVQAVASPGGSGSLRPSSGSEKLWQSWGWLVRQKGPRLNQQEGQVHRDTVSRRDPGGTDGTQVPSEDVRPPGVSASGDSPEPWGLSGCRGPLYGQAPVPSILTRRKRKYDLRGGGEEGTLLHCWWECKLMQPLWRTLWTFLGKLGIRPPCDLATPLLGMYPEETRTEKDTCTPMFVAALIATARTWKQPRCLSADEWVRKLRCIYSMVYYSAIKRNSFDSVLLGWKNLEPIIQNEVSQKEKDKYHILMHICEF